MLDNTFKTSTLCRSRNKGGIFWFLKLSNLRNIPLCNWVRQKGLRQEGLLLLVPLKAFLAAANLPLEPGPSRHLKHHPRCFWKGTHVAHSPSALATSTATHLQPSSLVSRRQLPPTPQSHRPPPSPPHRISLLIEGGSHPPLYRPMQAWKRCSSLPSVISLRLLKLTGQDRFSPKKRI